MTSFRKFRLALPLILFSLTSLQAQVVAIKNVRVIDGSGKPPVEAATLVIAGGRIRAVGPKVAVPKDATVVDGAGKTVIPGLFNLHGHVGLTKGLTQARENYTRENVLEQLRRYLHYGVTSVVSLGTDFEPIFEVRAEQRTGKLDGARVYTAGRGFSLKGGFPNLGAFSRPISAPEEVRPQVDELAAQKVDVIKMWVDDNLGRTPKFTPAVYTAIIDQAHKHNIKVMAHLFHLDDAKGLVDAGLDDMAHSVRDADVDDELIAKLKRRGAFAVATLTRDASLFIYPDSPAWLKDPFFRNFQPADAVAGVEREAYKKRVRDDPDYPKLRGFLTQAQRNLKKLSDAGVKIAFGTDSGPPARFQGWSEHWELELMVEAGLTPMQALVAATRNSAEALGVAKDYGTLEPGKAADFVVLDANPLDDIRNTRKIHSVWLAGKKM